MRVLILWRQAKLQIRNTIRDYALSFQRYDSENEYFYFNVYNGRYAEDYKWIEEGMFDAVLFHYSVLSLRYNDQFWNNYLHLMTEVWSNKTCIKILFPQDDYVLTERIWEFANSVKVDKIYTSIREKDISKMYPKNKISDIKIEAVLTGYVEESYLKEIIGLPHGKRQLDVIYRARKLPYELGKHSQLKYEIAELFKNKLSGSKLRINIDNTEDDKGAILGDNWLQFLSSSRTTIGCLGGAGIMDATGEIRSKVAEYMKNNPNATFEETKRACFPECSDYLLGVISPRIFECAMTKTCQILVGEDYQDILRPNIDYIVLNSDFSNIDEVIEKINDIEYCEQIANNCYENVIKSGKYSYKEFVKYILSEIEFDVSLCEKSEEISKKIEQKCKLNNDKVYEEIRINAQKRG